MAEAEDRMGYRSDIAFTPAVKAAQQARGSRAGYEKAMGRHDWDDRVTPALEGFIAERDSFYLGDGVERWAAVHSTPGRAEGVFESAR